MLTVLGQAKQSCDGLTRRDLMRVGGLSLFGGMTWPRLLRAGGAATSDGPAKSVILFNLLGGPSQIDMFDPKPDAPVEIRGEFEPINTSLPGICVSEHLPNTARLMHRASLIRTVTHGYNAHNPLPIMTGYTGGALMQLRVEATDPPDIGAVCQYLGLGAPDMPGAVCMPCYPGWGESSLYPGIRRPGPYGGYLGRQYDPLFTVCEPTFQRKPTRPYYDTVTPYGEPQLPAGHALPGMTANRLDRRRSLLEQVEQQFAAVQRSGSLERMDDFRQRAFTMLCTSKVRDAFDLSHEPDPLRDRYGRNMFGSSLLVARRLVEAGVPFISVHAENFLPHGSFTYDMHENNFAMLRDNNLPVLDKAWPALVEDLDARGLFDSTLIVVMGEMGRSPRVNSLAGRDHWPQCGFALLAGGGIRQGVVYGESDKEAAYPLSHPVSPADMVATIYHQLGIDPHMTVPDLSNRPVAIAHGGEPIHAIVQNA